MGYRWAEIANQNFQSGSDYLRSIANGARKAYCSVAAIGEAVPDVTDLLPPPLKALQEEFLRSVCELPEDPVPLPPPNRLPSNLGKCECQPYRVDYSVFVGGTLFETSFVNRLGPIAPFYEQRGSGGSSSRVAGVTHRGAVGGACSPSLIKDDLIVTGGTVKPSIQINNITLLTGSGGIECSRTTLPTDRPRSPTPPPIQLPPVSIPIPDLPPIVIPIFPVPLPVLPNVKFEPKLVIDVGGINVEFTIGEVNFTFNPELNAPITIFPPGYSQPSLPPVVRPDPSDFGEDCCEEILEILEVISSRTQRIDLNVQDVEQTTDNIEAVQSNNVIPLLEDIKKCACPPETVQVATFTNLQGYTYNDAGTDLAFAQVNVLTTDIKKTWNVDGGKEVAIVGWYAFGRDGRMGERRGLQFRNNLCLPEQRSLNEFTFGLYNGITASGTVHAETNEES